ncbi:MAG TPA: hypothetical protein VNK45_10800 [Candidatus Acidoferrales bacterium]|nr:hypothetical protein [Candidatus Acidoferrales bacterium]
MPVKLSQLTADRRACRLAVGDDTLTITYRPSGITPELEDQLREYTTDQRGGAALVTLLAHCLIEWDLLDDRGKPISPTAEHLRRLPTVFLGRVMQAIMEDLRPNSPNAGSFAAG